MVANTYSVRGRGPANRTTIERRKTKNKQNSWIPVAAAGFLTLMICLTVNYRAYTEFSREASENETLKQSVQAITTENLSLQEEIQSLKGDKKTVEREAKKFGYESSKDKIPVPAK